MHDRRRYRAVRRRRVDGRKNAGAGRDSDVGAGRRTDGMGQVERRIGTEHDGLYGASDNADREGGEANKDRRGGFHDEQMRFLVLSGQSLTVIWEELARHDPEVNVDKEEILSYGWAVSEASIGSTEKLIGFEGFTDDVLVYLWIVRAPI